MKALIISSLLFFSLRVLTNVNVAEHSRGLPADEVIVVTK
jgi:hypothetical protein